MYANRHEMIKEFPGLCQITPLQVIEISANNAHNCRSGEGHYGTIT